MNTELIKLAKERGFEGYLKNQWQYNTKEPLRYLFWLNELHKWLSEEHKIDIIIHRSFSMANSYHYCLVKDCDYDDENQQDCIPNRTYEQALEDGLLETMKFIKPSKDVN